MNKLTLSNKLVSIIILNFNGLKKEFLQNCLLSLYEQTYEEIEVILVDNASTDSSVEYVKTAFPQILLVNNQENVGFCRGNNIGYQMATGDYVFFLNNDTVLNETCVEKMVEGIDIHPNIGMIAPKLTRPNVEQPDLGELIDSAGLLLLNGMRLRDRGFGSVDSGQYNAPTRLFAPCGAAAFFRKTILDSIYMKYGEVWDEDFFAYYEDGDLAWRVHHEGWQCLYFPQATLVHYRGGSSPHSFFKKPFEYKVHTIKNRYLMIIKNASSHDVKRGWASLLKQEVAIWGYMVLHPRLLLSVLRALYLTVPNALRKRRIIKPEMRDLGDVLFSPQLLSEA